MTSNLETLLGDLDALVSECSTMRNFEIQTARMVREAAATIRDLSARVETLTEALTPSGDTKAAYMGEFHFSLCGIDEFGDETSTKIYVPWDTIKEIMAAIKDRALKESRHG